ncbi:MAG: hypothetical protein KDJ97_26755 [Anaerolineae bacterium]|nr:hypothetical protein [Anaerolineae bacterium]
MKSGKQVTLINLASVLLLILVMAACAANDSTPKLPPASDTVVDTSLEPTDPAPSSDQVAPTPSPAADSLQPYPYTTPLPPPTPTILDGLYNKQVNFEGTPTPCRRCAPYRAEGGTWTLKLDSGAFRVSHDGTGFHGIGSFTIVGDKLTVFNDPNCHLETGTYIWEADGRSLVLKTDDDPCAFGLRAKNLGLGVWTKQSGAEGSLIDRCQPPSLEAAISGHWPTPEGC